MNDHRFRLLEIAMVRRGVALRHARRAALELECHHRELVEQALARGESPGHAQQSAHQTLGSDAVLIERYARQKELRSWACRWRAAYLVAPLLGFMAVSTAEMGSLVVIASHLSPRMRHMRLPGLLTHDIDFLVRVLVLWVIPVAVAIAVGVLANRQRIALRWPLAGILLLCAVVALMKVRFVVTGGSPAGYARAAIGLNSARLPHQLLRAVLTSVIALVPIGWLRLRESSRRPTPD